jgi:hypothetical protein
MPAWAAELASSPMAKMLATTRFIGSPILGRDLVIMAQKLSQSLFTPVFGP